MAEKRGRRSLRRRLPTARVELLLGHDTIRDRLDLLVTGARNEIRSLVPAWALDGVAMRDGPRVGPPPGVGVRTVWSEQSLADEQTRGLIASMAEFGVEVRGHDDPPMRLLLIDGDAGLVPVDPADPGRGCYLMLCPGLVGPLAALFEVVWQSARPLTVADGVGLPVLPSPALRAALAMMRDGHTDDAIGRRLGVSSRTVRRWMSEAMQQLHTTTRFELGVAAARRGWVAEDGATPPPVGHTGRPVGPARVIG